MAEHGLRRVFVFLVIKPIDAAEIGDAALGGNSGSAEENDIVAALYHPGEPGDALTFHCREASHHFVSIQYTQFA